MSGNDINRVSPTQTHLATETWRVDGEAYDRTQLDGLGRILRGSGLIEPIVQPFKSYTLVGPALTLTTAPAADGFLAASNAHIHPVDLAGAVQARLTGRITTVGAAAHKIQARFRAGAFSTTITDYLIMGATTVEIGTVALGIIDSGWINLVTAAKADGIFLGVMSIGGDGALSPIVANLRIDFR